jgi:hypothetical protein
MYIEYLNWKNEKKNTLKKKNMFILDTFCVPSDLTDILRYLIRLGL